MAGETPDVPIIRQQPGVKELDRSVPAKVTVNKNNQVYGRVYTNAADGQTNMVRAPGLYTWDDYTAGNAIHTTPGHIKFYDEQSGRTFRVPLLHSVWDD
jgi:hypothetical protein